MTRKDNITFWRVIACVGVFVVHLGQAMCLDGGLRDISDLGAYGVEMFFVISGYLLYKSFEASDGLFKYYLKRAIRILPLYYVVIFYYFITGTFIFHDVPVDTAGLGWSRYFVFLSGFVKAEDIYWSNLGMTWTIPVFVVIYILAPVFHKYINNYVMAWLLCIFSAWIRIKGLPFCANGNFMVLNYIFFFSVGLIIYYTVEAEKENITILLFALATFLFVFKNCSGDMIITMLFGICFIVTMDITFKNQFIRKIFYAFDKYSYTIYLVQGIVFKDLVYRNDFNWISTLLVSIVGTGILSILAYHLIEKPIAGMQMKSPSNS